MGILAAFGGASEAVDLEPADSTLLHDASLYAPDLNLSLEAPGAEWEWLASPQETGTGPNRYRAFACRLRGTPTQFLVGVFNPYWDALTPETATRFAAGVAATFNRQGWDIADQRIEPSDSPLPGSFRFQLSATDSSGARVFVYGYQATKGRMFTFQHASIEADEPPLFRSFVRSFRFIGGPPLDPLEGIGRVHLAGAAALTLLLGSAGWIINRMAGRIVVNLWSAALVLLPLGGVGLLLFWIPKLPADLPPERWGYILGYSIIGPLFCPLIFALWRSHALARRRASGRSA